jgi:hypothetical protein
LARLSKLGLGGPRCGKARLAIALASHGVFGMGAVWQGYGGVWTAPVRSAMARRGMQRSAGVRCGMVRSAKVRLGVAISGAVRSGEDKAVFENGEALLA